MFALLVPLFASPILFAFAFAFPLANWTRVNIYFIYLLARPACGILEGGWGPDTNKSKYGHGGTDFFPWIKIPGEGGMAPASNSFRHPADFSLPTLSFFLCRSHTSNAIITMPGIIRQLATPCELPRLRLKQSKVTPSTKGGEKPAMRTKSVTWDYPLSPVTPAK